MGDRGLESIAKAPSERLNTADFKGLIEKDDVPGVPREGWVRVKHEVPPAEPFQKGEAFVLRVDGARFLPDNITISKIVGSFYNSSREQVGEQFECGAMLDFGTFFPQYNFRTTVETSAWVDPLMFLLLRLELTGCEPFAVRGVRGQGRSWRPRGHLRLLIW